MVSPIEDYALIGDGETAGLVSRDGSVDWLCVPRFDSPACFAALLGGPEHGRWRLAPRDPVRVLRRCYRDATLVLETEYETGTGAITVVDCMPLRTGPPVLVRQVLGRRGMVPVHMELVIRYDYGSVVPWVRRSARGIRAVAGPDALALYTDIPLRGEGLTTVSVEVREPIPKKPEVRHHVHMKDFRQWLDARATPVQGTARDRRAGDSGRDSGDHRPGGDGAGRR